ncbi:unnamed protein product [Darwinula stevensoni]|uniref:SAP domain-containing protein n=1 Tax=Darwinula stevensoni TaxID=69355 RepID=A0A7R8XIU0_9CRUS|nr:unnamed protein product [Darwinula stevensoni]CAG0891562.1 unnamed protein product [Darwinula stevensoni]
MADNTRLHDLIVDGKPISSLRVIDLKSQLEKRGLSKSGSKKDLQERLISHLQLEESRESSSQDEDHVPNLELQNAAIAEDNDFIREYLASQQAIYQVQREAKKKVEEEIRRESETGSEASQEETDSSEIGSPPAGRSPKGHRGGSRRHLRRDSSGPQARMDVSSSSRKEQEGSHRKTRLSSMDGSGGRGDVEIAVPPKDISSMEKNEELVESVVKDDLQMTSGTESSSQKDSVPAPSQDKDMENVQMSTMKARKDDKMLPETKQDSNKKGEISAELESEYPLGAGAETQPIEGKSTVAENEGRLEKRDSEENKKIEPSKEIQESPDNKKHRREREKKDSGSLHSKETNLDAAKNAEGKKIDEGTPSQEPSREDDVKEKHKHRREEKKEKHKHHHHHHHHREEQRDHKDEKEKRDKEDKLHSKETKIDKDHDQERHHKDDKDKEEREEVVPGDHNKQEEKEKQDKVEKEKEKLDKIEKEKEKLDKIEKEKEKLDKMEKEKEKLDKIEKEKEKQDKMEKEKEKLDKIEKEKEKQDKMEKEKEKQDKMEKEKEKLDKIEKEKEKLDKMEKEKDEDKHEKEKDEETRNMKMEIAIKAEFCSPVQENFKDNKEAEEKHREDIGGNIQGKDESLIDEKNNGRRIRLKRRPHAGSEDVPSPKVPKEELEVRGDAHSPRESQKEQEERVASECNHTELLPKEDKCLPTSLEKSSKEKSSKKKTSKSSKDEKSRKLNILEADEAADVVQIDVEDIRDAIDMDLDEHLNPDEPSRTESGEEKETTPPVSEGTSRVPQKVFPRRVLKLKRKSEQEGGLENDRPAPSEKTTLESGHDEKDSRQSSRKRRWKVNSAAPEVPGKSVEITTDSLKTLIDTTEVEGKDEETMSEGEVNESEEELTAPASEKEKTRSPSPPPVKEAPQPMKPKEPARKVTLKKLPPNEATVPSNRGKKDRGDLTPPHYPPSQVIVITNLVRPFTIAQLKELLGRTGTLLEGKFWIDRIKSKCYAMYQSKEEAIETRRALHGVKWPVSNPKELFVDFATVDELDAHLNDSEVGVGRIPSTDGREQVRSKEHDEGREKHREHPDHERDEKDRDRRGRERGKEKDGEDKNHRRSKASTDPNIREWDRAKIGERSPGEREREREARRRERERELEKKTRDLERSRDQVRAEKEPKEAPAKLLDDLFCKTKTTPCIYWLPLTAQQIDEKEGLRRRRMAERERRLAEMEKADKGPRRKWRD